MNKIMLFLFLFSVNICSGQIGNKDKFIKIIGNSQIVENATSAKLELILTEVQPNEYKQVRYKNIDQIKQEYIAELNKIGLNESFLKRDMTKLFGNNGGGYGYGSAISQNFNLEINDLKKLDDLSKILVDGVRVQNMTYIYQEVDYNDQLISNALIDARTKAESIAKKINMKIGKILNIEDSRDVNYSSYEANRTLIRTKYKTIVVNFELLD